MSCNSSLTAILKGCDTNTGGLTQFLVCPDEFITGVTVSAGTVTAIALSGSAKFVEYQFNKNTGNYVEKSEINLENGSTYFTTTTTLKIPRREVAKRQSLSLLLAGQRNVKAILKDGNGIYWLQGYANCANLTDLGGGSGQAKGDGTNYELTLLSEEPEMMYAVDPSIIAALIS